MYIIYVNNIEIMVNNTLPLAHEISRHFWAAYGKTNYFESIKADVKQGMISVENLYEMEGVRCGRLGLTLARVFWFRTSPPGFVKSTA